MEKKGVSIHAIEVTAADRESTKLVVKLEIMCEDEFEAIGWLVGELGKSV